MKLKLVSGEFTLIDKEDYLKVSKFKWFLDKSNGYVRRNYKSIYLHRFLLNPEKNLVVDHINGNTLDNRRKNLRAVSRSENGRNKKLNSNNTSGYQGVYFHKKTKKWKAAISINAKSVHIGLFFTKEEAYEAYRKEYNKYFKNFRQKI